MVLSRPPCLRHRHPGSRHLPDHRLGRCAQWGQRYGSPGYLFGALLTLAAFVCVTLHELGHSLVAQRFGVDVKEILLLPIGGVAQLRREPSKASQELWIAVAGPLVNVLIAVILFAVLRPQGFDEVLPRADSEVFRTDLARFCWLAVVLQRRPRALQHDSGAADGRRPGPPRAAHDVGRQAQGDALRGRARAAPRRRHHRLGVLGSRWPSARARRRVRLLRRGTGALVADRGVRVVRAPGWGDLRSGRARLSPSDQLGVVIDQLLRSSQSAFAVLHGKDLVGVVTREDVLRAAPSLGPAAPISQIMRRELKAVRAELPLDQLRSILIDQRSPAVVVANEGPLGVLTLEDLSRVAAVMHELASRGLRRPVPAPAPEG